MRLKKIKTDAEADLFLEKEHLPEHNHTIGGFSLVANWRQ
jgi:hypothetical protein